MKLINRPRQGGKTLAILNEMAKESNSVYVAANETHAKAAYDYSRRLGLQLERNQFVTARRVADLKSPSERKLYVDELEAVLYALLGAPVVAASGTFEPEQGAVNQEQIDARVQRVRNGEDVFQVFFSDNKI